MDLNSEVLDVASKLICLESMKFTSTFVVFPMQNLFKHATNGESSYSHMFFVRYIERLIFY
jgi:hypothetical protein